MKTIKGTIKVPRCWNRLIDTVFVETHGTGLKVRLPDGKKLEVTSEHSVKGNDDPMPHYDECRTVGAKMKDGATFQLDLCSGQSNYFCAVFIDKKGEVIYEDSEPLESLSSPIEIEADGKIYLVEIKWVGTDPYEYQKIKIKWTASFETEVVVGPDDDLDDVISNIDITQEGYVKDSFAVKMNKHGLL